MGAWLAITQRDWFRRVAEGGQPVAHFWLPTSWKRRTLTPGDRWYFRERDDDRLADRADRLRVLGHGEVERYEKTTPRAMFRQYGNGTGYATASELAQAIATAKPDPSAAPQDREVGNVVVRNVVLYPAPIALPQAPDLSSPNGRSYWSYDDGALRPELPVRTPDPIEDEGFNATLEALPPEKRERVLEVFARDRKHVRELKKLYGGICQITGKRVFDGVAGDLTEVHHIVWLARGGADIQDNMIVVSPDVHAAIHATDGALVWDQGRPVFVIGSKRMPLALNKHLKPTR